MRVAFTMKVHEGHQEEYEKRHNPIWDELKKTLFDHGVKTYSIFLDENTNTLFGYAEIESLEKWDSIADTAICRKWWDYMAPLMACNEDNSPVSNPLKEVFHIQND